MDKKVKKIAVLVNPQRDAEGLRMASALPLCDDEVEVILLGESLSDDPDIATHLETLEFSDVPVFASFSDNRITTTSWENIAKLMDSYDEIVTF